MSRIPGTFIEECRSLLTTDYLPKIERCLERGRKVIRAVAVSGVYSIEGQIEEAYYLVHISIETINKVRKRRVGD